MSQLLSLVLETCGCGLPMALDGFVAIFSSTFRPKSTLILLPLFQLPKGKPQSSCPRLSISSLAWLASVTSFLSNNALPITRSFDPIVTAGNKRCSILVRLVSVNLSVAEMDMCLAVFIPNGLVNDGIGRFSR